MIWKVHCTQLMDNHLWPKCGIGSKFILNQNERNQSLISREVASSQKKLGGALAWILGRMQMSLEYKSSLYSLLLLAPPRFLQQLLPSLGKTLSFQLLLLVTGLIAICRYQYDCACYGLRYGHIYTLSPFALGLFYPLVVGTHDSGHYSPNKMTSKKGVLNKDHSIGSTQESSKEYSRENTQQEKGNTYVTTH